MPQYHPESPNVAFPDLARLRFIAELRNQLHNRLGKENREIYTSRLERPEDRTLSEPAAAARREEIRRQMESEPFFQAWSALLQSSQDLMWRVVGQSVSGDLPAMEGKLQGLEGPGTLELDESVEPPEYLRRSDTHRMPGSYFSQSSPSDLRAGALYDLGSAVYQFGRGNQGGRLLNDSRGRTTVAHLRQYHPQFRPESILDLGCSVGQNVLPLCDAFPQAEVTAIDIGAPMLRYARLRAHGLGYGVHFKQRNAEATGFADQSFDLVTSQILLHETSPDAVRAIIRESFRLLRPGGVNVHLEVPVRFEALDVFDQFFRTWEHYYNGEPNTVGIAGADLQGEMQSAGLAGVLAGFMAMAAAGASDPQPLLLRPAGQGRSLYVVSGVRPPL